VKPRFQADNDLRGSIRTGVLRREPSVDFQSAHKAKFDGLPDPDVLRLAAEEGRILISHALWCCRGTPLGSAIESVVLIWLASEADEWIDRIVWLPFSGL